MNITIISREENNEEIINDITRKINQTAARELDWKIEHIGKAIFLSTCCYKNETQIESLFDEILKLYPKIDINASYSYSIREDDGSADWWETVSISTVENSDGTRYLDKSCSTYWN